MLHALKAGVDGVNGVYTYGAGGVVPSTGIDSNYWVQPVYDVTHDTVAGAPTAVTATAGNASATVSWTAAVQRRGQPITGYTDHPLHRRRRPVPTRRRNSTATTQTVTGLTNGTTYTFTVPPSTAPAPAPDSAAPTAVTPADRARRPTAHRHRRQRPGRGVLDRARRNGGSAITGYTVTPYIGAVAQTADHVQLAPPPRRPSPGSPTAPPTRSPWPPPTRSAPAPPRPLRTAVTPATVPGAPTR